MAGGYSMTNCGGPEVTCPLCTGKGEIEDAKEVKVTVKRKRKPVVKVEKDEQTSEV